MSTINNGEVAYPSQFPWQVLIGVEDSVTGELSTCGGSLITHQHILTAAHCIDGRSVEEISVLVGNHDWKEAQKTAQDDFRYIIEIKIFPSYSHWKSESDIGLLTLEHSVSFSTSLKPICLPLDRSRTYENELAAVCGWGVDSGLKETSDVLKWVKVSVMDNKYCKKKWKWIKSFHLCTDPDQGKSHCKGDSGGALFKIENGRYTVLGIASFGSKSSCGLLPGGFARITEDVFTWINSSIDTRKVNGGWGDWTPWSTCEHNCRKYRFRGCVNPPPGNGGRDCVGYRHEDLPCEAGKCSVNGGWGDWTSWSACANNCRRTRSRKCNNPVPENGGKDCVGNDDETEKCCPNTMVITSSKVVDLSDWDSDVIKVLAIGGGGGRYYGGGGSGYLFIGTIKATGNRRMTISIGDGGGKNQNGEKTTVKNADGITVTARGGNRGSHGVHGNGGSGWSGGGGKHAAGGKNGGDGKTGLHIHYGGDGQQISIPTIKGVSIAPGNGGEPGHIWGGGGGGLVVNGKGKNSERGAAQGYGAGGGHHNVKGQYGVVILYEPQK